MFVTNTTENVTVTKNVFEFFIFIRIRFHVPSCTPMGVPILPTRNAGQAKRRIAFYVRTHRIIINTIVIEIIQVHSTCTYKGDAFNFNELLRRFVRDRKFENDLGILLSNHLPRRACRFVKFKR